MEALATHCGGDSAGGGSMAGGYAAVEYLPIAHVDMATYEWMVSDAGVFVGVADAASGYAWLSAGVGPKDKPWSDGGAPDVQGGTHDRRVSGSIPTTLAAATPLLDEMKRHRYLVRVTDRAGNRYLLSSVNNPSAFDFAFDGGGAAASGNVLKIDFVIRSPLAAAIWAI